MPLTADDERQIRTLISRYCWAVDMADGDAYAATFAPDGIFERSSGRVVQGREQLRDIPGTLSGEPGARQHWVTNLVLEGDGERAAGKAYVMVFRLENGQLVHTLSGSYDDELVKLDGQWLFSRRRSRRWPLERG
ncbi:MAG: nuclear transport factor 2 family protein [Chloroflexi bacterium]|nr:nuclear transport factor 2 family protein [Chloroflexota bacterium]